MGVGTVRGRCGRVGRGVVALAGVVILAAPAAAAVCGGGPERAGGAGGGPDDLPRLELIAADGAGGCRVAALPAYLPGTVAFALRASNLLDGATGARLRLIASEPIDGFLPSAGLVAQATPAEAGAGTWALDVRLDGAPFCGPALLGEVRLAVRSGCPGLWADVTGPGGDGLPTVVLVRGGETRALCPRHGAYAGPPDLHHCQPPLCPEPNDPVRDFAPLASADSRVLLGWTAGGGNFTAIRCRSDGRSPVSLADGELLALVATVPGGSYVWAHENPSLPRYWYAAFAITMAGDAVVLGGSLECDSLTSAELDPSVPATPATWGTLKRLYR